MGIMHGMILLVLGTPLACVSFIISALIVYFMRKPKNRSRFVMLSIVALPVWLLAFVVISGLLLHPLALGPYEELYVSIGVPALLPFIALVVSLMTEPLP